MTVSSNQLPLTLPITDKAGRVTQPWSFFFSGLQNATGNSSTGGTSITVNTKNTSTLNFSNYFSTSWSANTTLVSLDPALLPNQGIQLSVSGCTYPGTTSINFAPQFSSSFSGNTVTVALPNIITVEQNGTTLSNIAAVNFANTLVTSYDVTTNTFTVGANAASGASLILEANGTAQTANTLNFGSGLEASLSGNILTINTSPVTALILEANGTAQTANTLNFGSGLEASLSGNVLTINTSPVTALILEANGTTQTANTLNFGSGLEASLSGNILTINTSPVTAQTTSWTVSNVSYGAYSNVSVNGFTATTGSGLITLTPNVVPSIIEIESGGTVLGNVSIINFGANITASVSGNVATINSVSGGGAASQPILNQISGLTIGACYSVRLLNSAYTGNCMQVRRSSDNTTTNVGFVNGVIDEASLTTFVGANSGYVVTWYDQSGNGLDVTQTTTTEQPLIINSGTPSLLGGGSPIWALNFDSTQSQQLMSASQSVLSSGATGSAMLCVAAWDAIAGSNPAVMSYGIASSYASRGIYGSGYTWATTTYGTNYSPQALNIPSAFGVNLVAAPGGTWCAVNTYYNGVFSGSAQASTLATPSPSTIYVGNALFGSPWGGKIAEAIFLNGFVENNSIMTIQNNQGTYYAV